MKRIILFIILICSANLIFASTTLETNFHKTKYFEEVQSTFDLFKREMSITMTDECGRTWTLTASCGSCTNAVLNDAIWEYWQDNLNYQGCFQKPGIPEEV